MPMSSPLVHPLLRWLVAAVLLAALASTLLMTAPGSASAAEVGAPRCRGGFEWIPGQTC